MDGVETITYFGSEKIVPYLKKWKKIRRRISKTLSVLYYALLNFTALTNSVHLFPNAVFSVERRNN